MSLYPPSHAAFEYVAAQRYDIVSISFGGYLDRTDPEQDAIYQQYVRAVADARQAGTLIIASAGNGRAIGGREAYGAGIVDALSAVR